MPRFGCGWGARGFGGGPAPPPPETSSPVAGTPAAGPPPLWGGGEVGRAPPPQLADLVLPRRVHAAVRPDLDVVAERAHVLEVVPGGVELHGARRERHRDHRLRGGGQRSEERRV